MIHKNCGGEIYEVEYACGVQLHCEKCRKKWQLFDSMDDIVDAPKGSKLIDSFPIGHIEGTDVPFAMHVRSTWNTIGKKLRSIIEGS